MAAIDLRRVRVASPCSEKWSEMTGDERVRFCAKCRLNVYDFRALSEPEIVALLEKNEGGRVCGRIHRRADGTMITRDCPVGQRRARRKVVAAVSMTAALFGAAVAALFALRARSDGASGSSATEEQTATATFWSGARERAVAIEDRARKVPVLGDLIEKIDPAPVPEVETMTAGMIINPRPLVRGAPNPLEALDEPDTPSPQ